MHRCRTEKLVKGYFGNCRATTATRHTSGERMYDTKYAERIAEAIRSDTMHTAKPSVCLMCARKKNCNTFTVKRDKQSNDMYPYNERMLTYICDTNFIYSLRWIGIATR